MTHNNSDNHLLPNSAVGAAIAHWSLENNWYLASEKDRFGLYRTSLNWQLLPIDKNTIRTAALEFAKYFARNGHGRIKIDNWILDEDAVFPSFVDGHEMAGNHHMGTTRMGATPRTAVTDKNCKVFGVDNLYIAGSSVFCTCGHANPTFTIVQLSLRLAKHLSS